MSYMNDRMKNSLDNWITGHYGEDQYKDKEDEREEDEEESEEGWLDDYEDITNKSDWLDDNDDSRYEEFDRDDDFFEDNDPRERID